MARTKKTPRAVIRQLRAEIRRLQELERIARQKNDYYRENLVAIEAEAKRREAANVQNLTNAVTQLIQTVSGRNVKSLTWSWQ